MKRIIKIMTLALALALILCVIPSCSGGGDAMMTLGDKTLTLNEYELLLSRMKGALYTYGYDVTSDSFWKTVVSADGMTFDDYFSITIMEEASEYLIADYLFDLSGLSLTDERIAEVDTLMDALVEHAGSKTALNATLKDFGVNYNILREVYLRESRIDMLKDHLFGNEGEKIGEEEREAYLNERYVAFGQIFLASYYYVTDLDAFGDTVYYTDDTHKAIAYDKVNGKTQLDEFGKTVTDILGDAEYYTEDGRIAYDKENGVVGYVKDSSGNYLTEKYDEETLGEMFDRAGKYAEECNGDLELFLEYARSFDESDTKGEITYLVCESEYYRSQVESMGYLDEIAAGLTQMQLGECRAAQSEYGFHVFMKYEIEEGAYADEAHESSFSDFESTLIDLLFDRECAKYESDITLDTAVAEKAPAMSEVGINLLY